MKTRVVLVAGTGLLLTGCGIDGAIGMDLSLMPDLCAGTGETVTASVQLPDSVDSRSYLIASGLRGPDSNAINFPERVAIDHNPVSITLAVASDATPGSYQLSYDIASSSAEDAIAHRQPITIVIGGCE
jgi:hypothetical protein